MCEGPHKNKYNTYTKNSLLTCKLTPTLSISLFLTKTGALQCTRRRDLLFSCRQRWADLASSREIYIATIDMKELSDPHSALGVFPVATDELCDGAADMRETPHLMVLTGWKRGKCASLVAAGPVMCTWCGRIWLWAVCDEYCVMVQWTWRNSRIPTQPLEYS